MTEGEWGFTEPSFSLAVGDWVRIYRPHKDRIRGFFGWCDHVSEHGPPRGTPYNDPDTLLGEERDVLTCSIGELKVVINYLQSDEMRNITLHSIVG